MRGKSRQRNRPDTSGRAGFITLEGYRRLEEEAAHLWNIERPKVTKAVATAAAEGDRSENAEYIYSKKKLMEIDRRLKFLGKRLEVLQIVDGVPKDDGKVYFGCWVLLLNGEGFEKTYRIVGPDETGADPDSISCDSPVARAILGKEEGDEVFVQRPKGDIYMEIQKVYVSNPYSKGPRSSQT
ncbi:MAG: transcription elongation factor GreB [Myxococcota bacterium]